MVINNDNQNNNQHAKNKLMKMLIVFASILSAPMIIFLIIFCVIWHGFTADFNRDHDRFMNAQDRWEKGFQSAWDRNEAVMRQFDKDDAELHKKFEESDKRLQEGWDAAYGPDFESKQDDATAPKTDSVNNKAKNDLR